MTIRLCEIWTLTKGGIDVRFVGVILNLALQAAHTAERHLLVTTRCVSAHGHVTMQSSDVCVASADGGRLSDEWLRRN